MTLYLPSQRQKEFLHDGDHDGDHDDDDDHGGDHDRDDDHDDGRGHVNAQMTLIRMLEIEQ